MSLKETSKFLALILRHKPAVKVGSRHGSPVVYQIDTGRMAADGYDFYLSANGVWLTKTVPPEYLKRYGDTPQLPEKGQSGII